MSLSHAGRPVAAVVTVLALGPLTGLSAVPAAATQSLVAATSAALPSRGTTGSAWTEVGPTTSAFEYFGSTATTHISSGRVTKVRSDPANPAQVYLATAGGGIWKTPDITAATPTWTPLTDTQPTLATGAFTIDPSSSTTLYAGLGETIDGLSGGLGAGDGRASVIKSTDGGTTWGTPVPLTATLDSGTVTAQAVRDLAVDPHDSQIVLATTDIGLFRSTDGGASYANVALPGATAPAQTNELSYVGATGGTSTWVVSGTHSGTTPTDSMTLGDIWRSSDAGGTWTSLRDTSKLPTALSVGSDYGRISVAAAPSETDPTLATVWAVVASDNGGDPTSSTVAVFKSTNGGQTFTTSATSTTATINPPRDAGNTVHECSNMNVGHANSWYSLAIAVDPANPLDALVGGDKCTYRTTDGGVTWYVASHWSPEYAGTTGSGVLPYVHRYVQDIALVDTAGGVRALVGSEGGIGVGTNVFGVPNPEQVSWTAPNTGLRTLQVISAAAGDTSAGDAGVVLAATYNGARFHAAGAPAGTFDKVTDGYAYGASIGRTSGGATVYWQSTLATSARYCQATVDPGYCDDGSHWSLTPSWANGTTDPLSTIYFSAIPGDANGRQVTNSTYGVFLLSSASPGTIPVNLTSTGLLVNGTKTGVRVADAGQFPSGGHEYIGVAMASGYAAVGDLVGSAATWTVASAQSPLNGTSGTAFPRQATSLGGSTDGTTYLLSSASPTQRDGSLVPDSVGHLFLTTDAGAHWSPFHGDGTGADLPNVPVSRVAFDPLDQTDSVIYAGTARGVYVSRDTGATWHRLGTGLPNAAVRDIWFSPDGTTMDVATFGRGVWELSINQATTTTLTSDDLTPKDGQAVHLTATVSPSDAGGTVEFTDGGMSIGSASVSGGTATLLTAALPAGSHDLQASYGGDLTHEPSTGLLTLDVTALQSVTVAPSPATLKDGQTKQLTATGHYADSTTADLTSTVSWGSGTPAVATVSSTGLVNGVTPGTTLVTATASGTDGPHAGSSAVTVTGYPAVSINSLPVATLTPSVTVSFNGSEAYGQITSYDVRYRVAGSSSTGWSSWSTPAKVTARKVGMTVAAGKTRCAQVRSRDAVGATSAWSRPVCTARALDDPSLTASAGWAKVTGSAFYGGSIRLSKRTGRTLTLKGAHIDRIGVVVTRCAGCGKLDVLVNGKVLKTVALGATSTHNRVLVMLPAFYYRTATVVLRTRSTRPVKVDGLVATRI